MALTTVIKAAVTSVIVIGIMAAIAYVAINQHTVQDSFTEPTMWIPNTTLPYHIANVTLKYTAI